jgi:hypothetical protein
MYGIPEVLHWRKLQLYTGNCLLEAWNPDYQLLNIVTVNSYTVCYTAVCCNHGVFVAISTLETVTGVVNVAHDSIIIIIIAVNIILN